MKLWAGYHVGWSARSHAGRLSSRGGDSAAGKEELEPGHVTVFLLSIFFWE